MTAIPLSKMIQNAGEATPPRIGASGDYALVRKHFDLIAAARAAGIPWKSISSAEEFVGLESHNPDKTISNYFRAIERRRIKAAEKLVAAKPPAQLVTSPIVEPVAVVPVSAFQPPPPPGSAPPPANNFFESLPSLARKAR